MKKALKVDNVVCDPMELDPFSFTFSSDTNKHKVLDASQCSFSSNLLILQQLNPKVPIHRHDFSRCAFWVQIIGLPLAMITENVLGQLGTNMGEVMDVKMEARGGSPCKVGRVRVLLELSTLLKPGMVVNTEDDQLWVDFKYDRLPHVCYSCERIRHYTTSCEIVLYKEPGPGETKSSNLGYWLKAEARMAIPYWRVYHGNDFHVLEE